MGSLSTSHRDTEYGSSGNGQENIDKTSGLKTKITKKDSMFAFDLRDTGDLSSYNQKKLSSLNMKNKFHL